MITGDGLWHFISRPFAPGGSTGVSRTAEAPQHARTFDTCSAASPEFPNSTTRSPTSPATTSPREAYVSNVNAGTACDDTPQNNTHEHTTAINLIAFT